MDLFKLLRRARACWDYLWLGLALLWSVMNILDALFQLQMIGLA